MRDVSVIEGGLAKFILEKEGNHSHAFDMGLFLGSVGN